MTPEWSKTKEEELKKEALKQFKAVLFYDTPEEFWVGCGCPFNTSVFHIKNVRPILSDSQRTSLGNYVNISDDFSKKNNPTFMGSHSPGGIFSSGTISYFGPQNFAKHAIEINMEGVGSVATKDVLFLLRPPLEIHFDNNSRLHRTDGPAILFHGEKENRYFIHGVIVKKRYIYNTLMFKEILDERNQEVRRVLIDKYGMDKFIKDAEIKVVNEDNYGKLVEIPRAGF